MSWEVDGSICTSVLVLDWEVEMIERYYELSNSSAAVFL